MIDDPLGPEQPARQKTGHVRFLHRDRKDVPSLHETLSVRIFRASVAESRKDGQVVWIRVP